MVETRAPSGREQRNAARFDTRLPLRIDGSDGLTQNISAHGVNFETEVEPPLGALVNFSLEFTQNGRPQRLLCEGKVVRVEREADCFRVAARLLAPLFEFEEA
jgi:hypothetical protein